MGGDIKTAAPDVAERKPLGGDIVAEPTKRNKRKPGSDASVTVQGHQRLPPKEAPAPAKAPPKASAAPVTAAAAKPAPKAAPGTGGVAAATAPAAASGTAENAAAAAPKKGGKGPRASKGEEQPAAAAAAAPAGAAEAAPQAPKGERRDRKAPVAASSKTVESPPAAAAAPATAAPVAAAADASAAAAAPARRDRKAPKDKPATQPTPPPVAAAVPLVSPIAPLTAGLPAIPPGGVVLDGPAAVRVGVLPQPRVQVGVAAAAAKPTAKKSVPVAPSVVVGARPAIPAVPARRVDPLAMPLPPAFIGGGAAVPVVPPTHNVKLLCVLHGQLRFVNHMSRRPDGTYVCNPDKTCKPEFAPAHLTAAAAIPLRAPALAAAAAFAPANAAAAAMSTRALPPTHGIKKQCAAHNQMRFVNHLTQQADGTFTCNADKQCKPEFAASAAPGAAAEGETHGVKKMCSMHNQMRFVNHLLPKGGAYVCRPDRLCRPEVPLVNPAVVQAVIQQQLQQVLASSGQLAARAAPHQRNVQPAKPHNPNHNVKKLCSAHNQMRFFNALVEQPDGTFVCSESKQCKAEFNDVSSPEAIEQRRQQRAEQQQQQQQAQPQRPANYGVKKECATHKRQRYAQHLIEQPDGTFVCSPEAQCKTEATNPYLKASTTGSHHGGFW